MPQVVEKILGFIAKFLAIAIVISFHEFAHAFSAVKNGDPTPRLYNRYTLNPIAHFDLFGMLMFLFAGFGWAKPVPINPDNFRNYNKGLFWTSIAGVAMNLLMAFIAYPIYRLCLKLPDMLLFDDLIVLFFNYVYVLSLCFTVFNLLPIYPLDGFRVVESLTKGRGGYVRFNKQYGHIILIALFGLGIIADITHLYFLDVLSILMNFTVNIIGYPIQFIWSFI